ncbi:MAG: hypothetical protein AAF682_10895 [Planctomycetota bacterium]
MELRLTPPDDDLSGSRVRTSSIPDLVMALAALGVLGAAGYLARSAFLDPSLLEAIIKLPFALLFGLIFFAIAVSAFGSFRNSLKPTNWRAHVARDAVFLNLRSYRNAHFGGEDPTVVRVELKEVAFVRKVTEQWIDPCSTKRRLRRQSFVEIHLVHTDTAALADAVHRERTREAPTIKRFGIESSTKHHDTPVFVHAPDIVRATWHRGLFRELGKRVKTEESHFVDLNKEIDESSPEERAFALALRGQRMAALRIGEKELGFSGEEARAWLEELRRDAA